MDLEKHILDTMKEWQLKIGYREGKMKLYYPGESLAYLLKLPLQSGKGCAEALESALSVFCKEIEPRLGRIEVSGDFERYCLTISEKGCAYVANMVAEPVFLRIFLETLTKPGNGMAQMEECFAWYAGEHETVYQRENMDDTDFNSHGGAAFYFADAALDEYVYWVEQNEFGLNYHRFTREEYRRLRECEG